MHGWRNEALSLRVLRRSRLCTSTRQRELPRRRFTRRPRARPEGRKTRISFSAKEVPVLLTSQAAYATFIRWVLPVPLAPMMALMPGAGANSSSSKAREALQSELRERHDPGTIPKLWSPQAEAGLIAPRVRSAPREREYWGFSCSKSTLLPTRRLPPQPSVAGDPDLLLGDELQQGRGPRLGRLDAAADRRNDLARIRDPLAVAAEGLGHVGVVA